MSTCFSKGLWCCIAAVLLLCFDAQQAFSQVLYGSIVGVVEDQSGALLPDVEVVATNTPTGQTRTVQADSQGAFNITNVLPGIYNVQATAAGFRTVNQEKLTLNAGQVARTQFRMEVGSTKDSVNVSAQAAQLQTDKAGSTSTLTSKPIQQLPMSTYRNYQSLINLVPGATPAQAQNSATDSPGRSLRTNINGTAANMNTTRTDGAVNINIWLPHHNAYVAPSETVQEVSVNTTALDAEQGSAGGAAINVTTKSGTNELHGAAWEYHNNQEMKSRPYFMPATTQKPRDTLNIFGAAVGGPIIKNKLFYFGNFELTRQRTGGFGLFDVPTAQRRVGNFQGTTNTSVVDPTTGLPFANNVIPTNRLNPVTQNILGRLPLPNIPGREVQNYSSTATGIFDRNNYDYKINWNRNERHSIWGRSSFLKANVVGYGAFGELVGPAVVQDPGAGDTFVQLHTIGHTYTITPNFLLEQTLGFSRQTQTVLGDDYGTNWGSEIFGIPGTNGPDIRQSGMPTFNYGYSAIGQTATWIPLFRTEQTTTHSTNLSLLKGAHDVRFGFNLVRFNLNHYQPEQASPRGSFDFNGNLTRDNRANAPGINQFNSLASFLLGQANNINKSVQYIEMTGREWQFDWYVRDRWQVNRKLTVSLGLKYAYYPLMRRRDSGLERYDPLTNQMFLGGRGDTPQNAGISINSPGFAPTVGFAYRLNENTVIRSGYGLTWDPLPFSRPLRGFYPYVVTGQVLGSNESAVAGTLQTGIPAFSGPDVSSGLINNVPLGTDIRSPWGKINRGYIQSWNFTIENKLPGNFITSVAYVGTQSTNMLADRNINVGGPGTNTSALPLAQRFGRNIATNMWDGWLSSNYHSLQTSINRSFANGFLIKGAYTFSKAINNTDENGWAAVNWNWEPTLNRNRARAGYDRTHIFQLAYVYDLPFGRNRPFLNKGFTSWVLGNWSLSGTVYAFSGVPFTPTSSVQCACPGGTQTATLLNTPERLDQYGRGGYLYDPTAFSVGRNNTFGNLGRNSLVGPGVVGTDMSLSRIFPVKERMQFEIRGDAFNLTNTPQFTTPSGNTANVSNANFLQIQSAGGERQLRVGAVLRF